MHNISIILFCRNARQGDAHCRRINSIMQQDPPPSRAPREPIPWAAAPASSCAWPSQGGTSVPEPWPKPGPGHGNPTGPIPGARTGRAQTGAATSGGRVSWHPEPRQRVRSCLSHGPPGGSEKPRVSLSKLSTSTLVYVFEIYVFESN